MGRLASLVAGAAARIKFRRCNLLTGNSRLSRASTFGLASALTAIALIVTADATLARPPRPEPTGGATCVLSSAGVGQQLFLSGSGFAPNSQYVLFSASPGGSGATTVNTDQSGALISPLLFAYWPGTYGAQLWTEGHHTSEVASCSTAVS